MLWREQASLRGLSVSALTDRLKTAAKEGRWALQQLQRQVDYDRLTERLYLVDDRWIIKGRTLLVR